MQVVDYLPVHFETLGQTTIPAEIGGKFVIVTLAGEQYAIFAPYAMCTYHAQIVARFMQLRGMRGSLNTRGDRFHCSSDGWNVDGGGHWQRSPEGVLTLFGESTVYGGVDLDNLVSQLTGLAPLGARHLLVK